MRREMNNMDDLLVKYLLDESTRQERGEVEKWVAAKTGNRIYFENFKLIWKRSKTLAAHNDVDEDIAWIRFKDKMQETEIPVIPLKTNPLFKYFRIAVAIVLVAGGSWLTYLMATKDSFSQEISVHSGAKTLVKTLPDGSIITLNKNSKITYGKDFTAGGTRKVKLKGEAFFQVTPDKTKPFLVDANEVIVRVVGTSFNVKSSIKQTEVIVETGLVEVTKKEEKVKIKPTEKVTVFEDQSVLAVKKNEDQFYKYYRTDKLVCHDTPLWKLANVLSDVYQRQIIVSNERKNLPITTTFDGKSLDEVLMIISETFNITVVRNDGQIILK
ncbi:FecR domain-containing protein [Dyadobacter sp. CY345]|uniref:FecR family protein n=1 Tax=Dyadobacter sp. CY345 TaxID=2909335 RepID=UPI001F343AD0|nr:FecR domain-containing protein [Dyadobacter sp. CY345]MCF2444959.1 FecR domain-containing protein [Dyadobacter sp. CY345]